MYQAEKLHFRENISFENKHIARRVLPGYYAHVSALDYYLRNLMTAIQEYSYSEDTIFIYISDHGDMLGSHGVVNKQYPWDESIKV